MSESCCRPIAKLRLKSGNQALLTAMREIKAGATTTGKPSAGGSSDSSTASSNSQLLPRLLLNPIYSARRIGEATAAAIRGSSASSLWNFASTRPRLRSGAIFRIPARVDVWSRLHIQSSLGPRSKSACGLPNGKIWVKGFALSGVVSRSGPTNGVRIHFEGMAPAERDNLRQFLKFVQETTRGPQSENGYLQLLK